MENKPDFEKEQNLTPQAPWEPQNPENSVQSDSVAPPVEGLRYGAVANQDTRWVYGDQEYQGGNPQAYVAEQRRLEEEKRAREKAEAEKTAEARKKASMQDTGGFFSSSDFQSGQQSRYSPSENRFHEVSTPTPPNSNFGPADMSGQHRGVGGGIQYGNGPQYGGGKLPSRKGPIAMFVIGLLIFLIIAPLVFSGGIIGIIAGANTTQVLDQSEVQLQVEKDTYTVVIAKRSDLSKPITCEASQNGKKLANVVGDVNEDTNQDQMFIYQTMADGKLDIKCFDENSKAPLQISVVTGISLTIFVVLFVIASILGILGLVFTIWGIIWWVRRSRQRRMALMGF